MFTRRGREIDRQPLGLGVKRHQRAEHLEHVWDGHHIVCHDLAVSEAPPVPCPPPWLKQSQAKVTELLEQWAEWDTGAGATVAQGPEPGQGVRHRCRSQSGTDLPNSHKLAQGLPVGAEGLEPPTCWL